MDEKKKVYKLYKEVVEECQYCPKNEAGWIETHCLKEKPARVITKERYKTFSGVVQARRL